MPDASSVPSFTIAGILRGGRALLPVAVFVIPYGIAFAIAAGEAGLSGPATLAMSAGVFAGASQFAVLDIWGPEIALWPMIAVTLAVNARLILAGAALSRWLRHFAWWKRMVAVTMLSDANFATAEADYRRGGRDLGLLFGGGAVMWFAWCLGTAIGIAFGQQIPDPKALGLDLLMPTFFVAILAGSWSRKTTLLPWTVAGVVALGAAMVLPNNWHVIVGALAGGIAGACQK